MKSKKTKKAIALLLAILMMASSTAGALSVFAEEESSSAYNQNADDENGDVQSTQFHYMDIGETYQLPTDGDNITISDTNAFTVDEKTKLLTANEFGAGTVTIGYEDGTNNNYEFVVTCKIEATESNISLLPGSTYQIKLKNLLDEYKDEITWGSSDTQVATVDSNGLVTAVGTGSAKIRVTFYKDEEYEYSTEIKVTVKNDFVLNEKDIEMELGSTKKLAYSTSIDETKISWESEDNNVAVVTNGIIMSVGPGETKINAIYNKGESNEEILDSCSVKTSGSISINDIDEEKENVEIIKTDNATRCYMDYKQKLGLNLTASTSSILNDENYNKYITWSSSNEDVATVDEKGNIIVVGFGAATIKVTLFKDTASEFSDEIVVISPIDMSVSSSFESLQIGESITISLYSSSESVISEGFKWKSSDESIATVDESTGKVTAIKRGTVTIYPESDAINKIQRYLASEYEQDTSPFPVSCMIEVEDTTITKPTFSMYVGKSRDLNDNELLDAAIEKYEKENNITVNKEVSKGDSNVSSDISNVTPNDVSSSTSSEISNVTPSDASSSTSSEIFNASSESISSETTSNNVTAELVWVSDNDKIVSISGSEATGIDYGIAVVTPYIKTDAGNVELTDSNGETLRFEITVTYKFNMEEEKVIKIGESSKINCTGLPLEIILDKSNATWKSTDESIATVDEYGNVTAVAPGVCYIIFKSKEINRAENILTDSDDSELEYSCQVTTQYNFNVKTENQSLGIFENMKIDYDLDPYEIHNKITWSSSNEDVVKVDEEGNIYTVGFGQATITAKLFNTTETVDVNVSYENSTPETSEEKTLSIGSTDTIDLASHIPEGIDIDSSAFRWMSTNEEVLKVDEKGNVTAVGLGSAEIIAGVVNGSLTANYYSCKYNVVCDLSLESQKDITLFDSIHAKDLIKEISSEECISKIKWTINDESIVSIDSLGIITANKAGKTKITAEISGKKHESEINVTYDLGLNDFGVKIILGESFDIKNLYDIDNEPNDKLVALRDSLNYEIVDTNIAEIKDNEIIGKDFGTTKLKITSIYFNETYEVTIEVSYDFIIQADAKVNLGESINMISSKRPNNLPIVWESLNEDVATVDENGIVTTLNEGTTIIKATVLGKDKYEATVTVSLDSKIDVEPIVLVSKAMKAKLSLPENFIPDEVTWESTDESIATIDKEGNITGIKAGTVTIKATIKYKNFKKTYSVDITVDDIALEDINIVGDTMLIDLSSDNKLIKLSIEKTPANATGVGKATWKSSNENIAIVDEDGNVVGIKPGIVTITAEVDGKTSDYVINIIKSIKSIDIEFNYEQVTVNNTYQAILKVNPEDTTDTVSPKWSSSNDSIFTVDENGEVKTLNKGTATLKATVGNLEKEIEITVGGVDIPIDIEDPENFVSDSDITKPDDTPNVSDSDLPTVSDSDVTKPDDTKPSGSETTPGVDNVTDIDTGESNTPKIIAGILMALAVIGLCVVGYLRKSNEKNKESEELKNNSDKTFIEGSKDENEESEE